MNARDFPSVHHCFFATKLYEEPRIEPSYHIRAKIPSLCPSDCIGTRLPCFSLLHGRALSIGLKDFHTRIALGKGKEGYDAVGVHGGQSFGDIDQVVRLDVQESVSRFFTGRIGVRFLIEHHVSSVAQVRRKTRGHLLDF